MKFDPYKNCGEGLSSGFALRDLMACLAIGALLAILVVPVLANTRLRSQRTVCVSNLGVVGRAFNQWAGDHQGLYPFYVPAPVGTSNHPSGLNGQLWFQMTWLSNELTTPNVLACPGDPRVRPAFEFGLSSSGGYFHPNFQNFATSYFLGWPRPEEGRLILSGDAYLPGDYSTVPTTGFSLTWAVQKNAPDLGWVTTYHHQETGNLLFNDGSVETTDNPRLRAIFQEHPGTPDSPNVVRFLFPQPPRTIMPLHR